jgi:hypothetical protein
VTATVLDAAGMTVLTPFADQRQSARTHAFSLALDELLDGHYRLVVGAFGEDGRIATASADLVVDRALSAFAVTPAAVSPNADGVADAAAFSFALAKPALVTLQLLAAGTPATVVFAGELQPGPHQVEWRGPLPDGLYDAEIAVDDELGRLTQRVSLAVDTAPPVLQIVDAARLDFWLSEPATVFLLVDGRRVVKNEPAGTFHVPHVGPPPATLSGVAQDAAGNTGAPVGVG